MKKKLFAIVLALVMVLGLTTVSAMAAEGDVAYIGETGYPTLQAAINAASATDETVITLVDGNIDGDVNITIAAVGAQKGNIKIVAKENATPVITGTVTLGLYRRGTTDVAKWNSAVMFEGITFDHAESAKHSIDVQSVGGLTLTKCTIVGDGEYGIGSASGGNSDPSTITNCTFTNAGMQVTGNFGTGLVIDGCTFDNSCINVQGGNGVTVKNSTFNATVTDAHVGESFYAIRSNDIAITVQNTEFNIDSTVTGVATEQAKWGVLWQRQAGSTKWTVNDIEVNYTEAAMAQTELLLNKNGTSTEANQAGRVTITDLTSDNNNVADLIAKSEGYLLADGQTYLNGELDFTGKVAKIGSQGYETFEAALDAVQNGETITLLNVEGDEKGKEIDFDKAITFTITGTAPNYALPVVTFQNATVNIKDAEILIPELDARQNATINVIDSKVYDAGGNSIVKSYYNGAINISGSSVVYTMQVTTMGYITVSDTAELNATWQTNVYGNGMVTAEDDAVFNTAALHLTGQDYNDRDNTDADRVGKPAAIIVDGATLTVGKVLSSNGADYSYNSSHGINVGTIAGKPAVLDIKNGATVNIYMANGETANIGADGTVNIGGTVTVACRADGGTATLANNGTITLTDTSATLTANADQSIVTNVEGYGVSYVDGTYKLAKVVAEINGVKYTSLQEALDAAAAGTGDVTVEILTNIDLTNVDWNPVTVSAPGYPMVTVNGNNHTITGLNDMLFAGTWAGNSGLVINDLTIKDSNIVHDAEDASGNIGVGAFIGFPQASATITLNNCHLVKSTVKGGHWTGGLIGMAGGYNGNDGPVFMDLTIKNCSVTGSDITGMGSAGGVIGHGSCAAWTNVVIENTTVSGNAITSTGDSNVKAGAVMGTIGAAGQETTAAGQTKTGGAFVAATVSGNTVTSNGTPITTIYGRQGTPTGTLEVTGGAYDNYPIEEDVSYAAPKKDYTIYKNANGTYGLIKATSEESAKEAVITFTVTPSDAIIEIKKGDDVVGTTAGEYTLPGGDYTYTVTKSGYETATGSFTVDGADKDVTVTLSEIYYAPTYRVNVEKAENGTVKSSATYSTQSQRVTLTVTPDDGYVLDTLTVIDAKGNEIELTHKGDGKYTFKMPGRKVTVTATFLYDLPYSDVDVDDEFYDAVCFLHQQGLINGMGNNLYQPETSFNRAMIATMLHRLADLPEYGEAADLSDVEDGIWYTDAIHWGTEAGLINGYPDGTFAPGTDISVRELVVFLYRYAQYSENPDCDKSGWSGPTWADAGLAWAEANSILPEGEDLNSPASRALAAQVIYNVYNLLNK